MLSDHIPAYSMYYHLELQQSEDEGRDVSDCQTLVNKVVAQRTIAIIHKTNDMNM